MRISVLITTYNRAALVGEAVESVLAQTRPADEIIVIDDGSTDDTAARLAAFGDRIRVVAKDNGGVSSARNAGLAAASGDWITFLDDDDVWYPRRLEILQRDVRANPDVQVHVANMRFVGDGYSYDDMELYNLDAPTGSARTVENIFPYAIRGFSLISLACHRGNWRWILVASMKACTATRISSSLECWVTSARGLSPGISSRTVGAYQATTPPSRRSRHAISISAPNASWRSTRDFCPSTFLGRLVGSFWEPGISFFSATQER